MKLLGVLLFAVLLQFLYSSLFDKNNEVVASPAVNEFSAHNDNISVPQITLEDVFSNKDSSSGFSKDKLRTVLVTGDVLLARSVNARTVGMQDFNWPFEEVAGVIREADVAIINLETPLIKNCPVTHDGMIFCGDERNVEGLLFAGIDVVNFANNHAGNYGIDGIKNTIEVLEESDLLVSGALRPAVKSIRGMDFAFLGYSEFMQNGISFADETIIRDEIDRAKSFADVVVVQFHWGNEYTTDVSWNQKMLARIAIDAGADLVVGNHPHWIQPVEIYNGKLIVYSHGNFIFDQEWSLKTKQGIVGKYTFFEDKLLDVEFLPVQIEDFGQPHFLQDQRKVNILEDLKQLSSVLLGEE